MFLLDTDTCIDVLRGVGSVRKRMEDVSPDDCNVSSITVFELYSGIYFTRQPKGEGIKVDRFLSVLNIVPFDRSAAIEAAKLRQDLESNGTRIGPYDLLIAAQAISSNYTLVTANVCEFGRIKSLKLENWRAL
jgi:tRNA(fMet)-specific endonuclease VapC